jgi:hypothetical protein
MGEKKERLYVCATDGWKMEGHHQQVHVYCAMMLALCVDETAAATRIEAADEEFYNNSISMSVCTG